MGLVATERRRVLGRWWLPAMAAGVCGLGWPLTPAAGGEPAAAASPAPVPVPAEQPVTANRPVPTYQPPELRSLGPSPALLALRSVASLGLVVGLVVAIGWLLRVRAGLGPVDAGGRLRLLEQVGVGQGRTLHLVAVGGKVLLLGGGSELACLAQFEPEEVGYDPAEPVGSGTVESFLARLQAVRGDHGQVAFGKEARR